LVFSCWFMWVNFEWAFFEFHFIVKPSEFFFWQIFVGFSNKTFWEVLEFFGFLILNWLILLIFSKQLCHKIEKQNFQMMHLYSLQQRMTM
jgi:hypothetical protein